MTVTCNKCLLNHKGDYADYHYDFTGGFCSIRTFKNWLKRGMSDLSWNLKLKTESLIRFLLYLLSHYLKLTGRAIVRDEG